jgi:flagellum-specific ATP synthase
MDDVIEGRRSEQIHNVKDRLAAISDRWAKGSPQVQGTLKRSVGLTLEATRCSASVGDVCRIEVDDHRFVEAEVVGFSDGRVLLMPIGNSHGLSPGARVIPCATREEVRVGPDLLGRIIDGSGDPLDGKGQIPAYDSVPLESSPRNPLSRQPINQVFDVGIRSINALLTMGRGQRMGLFAGSGVGKSTLLGLMTRHSDADVVVVGLIGERGREVQEFVNQSLGSAGLNKSIVVATPADSGPVMRLRGALRATAIAEYFRDRGKNVLLLMDSLTRFAQAQREIALSIGELPVSRGYPPSVFAKLPQLVERAGNGTGNGGSITAIYTVLTEGDDADDPISDAARAVLDGHILLSRSLAETGLYPAINLESSVSRLMSSLVDHEHLEKIRQFRNLSATFDQNEDLISVGAYVKGADPRIDLAIEARPKLRAFIAQRLEEKAEFQSAKTALAQVIEGLVRPEQDVSDEG